MAETGGVTSLPRAEFERLLREGVEEKRRQQISDHSESLLLWLALAPAWPRPYIEAGFPSARGFVTGPAAIQAVERCVAAGLAQSGRNDADPDVPIYWMTQVQADSVLSFFAEQPRGPERMLEEFTKAAQAARKASSRHPLPDDLARWCRLGEAGPRQQAMAALLDREIDASVSHAEETNDTACPDARRWIETATPIATLFPGPLRVSLLRANRRFELFHRRAADRRHLVPNFRKRDEQIADFHRLLAEPDDKAWALHYVGTGGAGKTMLIRHITAELAPSPQLNLAVARIDFDHLNPDYPTREPALLLAALAEELRLYEQTHSGFDYFYSAVNALQESVDASGGTGGSEGALQRLGPALSAFIDAILKLEKRPLFILDTCEELAKLRPDGRIPDNVRVTFEILERIHKRIPSLRVIFSGRRPLASEGAGWRARGSILPKRGYLRLHIVSGFTREDALGYLQAYRDRDGNRPLHPSSFDEILLRSPALDTTFADRFELEDGASEKVERFNPFDLSMYAALAAAGQLTSGAGAHVYVKERIVDRLSPGVVLLVPPLASVGTFDAGLLEALCRELHLEYRASLADELAQQHWIDRVTSAAADDPMWTADPIHRRRLLDYYEEKDPQALIDGERALEKILPDFTLQRPWKNLSIAYFDTTLHLLQSDVPRALKWWQGVEEKIASDMEWDWGQRMTGALLATEEGSWEEAAAKVPDALLRASILATHAAASARGGRVEDTAVWEAVLGIEHEWDDERAHAVRRRAIAGIVNAWQWCPDPPAQVCERILAQWTELPGPTFAAELALMEGAVEVLERVPQELLAQTDSSPWRLIRALRHPLMAQYATAPVGKDLTAFWMSLRGRVAVLLGRDGEAESDFQSSLSEVDTMTWRRDYLDWTPPQEPRARLYLEAMRGLALRFDIRKMSFPDKLLYLPGDSLDWDRLASVRLIQRMADDLKGEGVSLSLRHAPGPARCNAHRMIPSYFATSAELEAAKGNIDAVLRAIRKAAKDAEVRADVLAQNDLARVHARLIIRYRLFEVGEKLSRLVAESSELEDRELTLRYRILTDPLDNTTQEERSGLLHGRYGSHLPPAAAMAVALANRQSLDDPAERLGLRRAAEIIVEECEIADGRLGAEPLAKAAKWFASADERLGVLRANVLATLADDSAMTPATIIASMPPDRAFFPPEDLTSLALSPRPVEDFVTRLNEMHAGIRPWATRTLAACLAATREWNTHHARESLWNRLTGRSPDIGRDLRGLLVVGSDPESMPRRRRDSKIPEKVGVALIPFALALVAWLFAKFFAWAPDGVKGGIVLLIVFGIAAMIIRKRETNEGSFGLLGLCIGWLVLYQLSSRIPRASVFGERWTFTSILAFNLIVGGIIYALSQTRRVGDWIRSLRIRAGRSVRLAPALGKMQLRSWLGSLTATLERRNEMPAEPTLPYVLLRNELTDASVATLDRWLKEAFAKPLEAHIRIPEPPNAGICWEAMFDPTLFQEGEERHMVAAYRTLPSLPMHRSEPSPVVNIATVYPASETWKPTDRFVPVPFDDDASIIHVCGRPTEVREGLRLELDETAQARSQLLRGDFAQDRAKAVFCILQGTPNDASVRTPTDRLIAAQLRQFGAEVFASGVPMVLVIPPLLTRWTYEIAALIGYAVVEERLRTKKDVLGLVHALRLFVRQSSDAEQAYDICLYFDHMPDLWSH